MTIDFAIEEFEKSVSEYKSKNNIFTRAEIKLSTISRYQPGYSNLTEDYWFGTTIQTTLGKSTELEDPHYWFTTLRASYEIKPVHPTKLRGYVISEKSIATLNPEKNMYNFETKVITWKPTLKMARLVADKLAINVREKIKQNCKSFEKEFKYF